MKKRTPKEVANFLGKPIALDSVRGIARWFWYDEVPIFVSLFFSVNGTQARAYATVNYCPMCGRKLEDV